jgi:hypothetical protein
MSNWLWAKVLSIQCNVPRVAYRLLCQVELNMKQSCQHFTVEWNISSKVVHFCGDISRVASKRIKASRPSCTLSEDASPPAPYYAISILRGYLYHIHPSWIFIPYLSFVDIYTISILRGYLYHIYPSWIFIPYPYFVDMVSCSYSAHRRWTGGRWFCSSFS